VVSLGCSQRPIAKRSKGETFAKQQYIGFVAVSDLLAGVFINH
jgi:hypothetical protein